MTFEPQWHEATTALQEAHTILIVSHRNPDGDAVGSLLGLANALLEQGKEVTCALDDAVPQNLRFLPGAQAIQHELLAGEWDLMISTDASDEERSGVVGAYGRAHSQRVINLDHHVTNTGFGHIHLVSVDAVSAAQVAYEWLCYMGHPISAEVAIPLMAGIVTDTLGFRVSTVTPQTLSIAQALMAAGASLHEIIVRTLDSMSGSTFALWQRILPRATQQDYIIYVDINPEDIRAVGLKEMTDGGIVSHLIQVDEARIAVVYKVISDEQVQVSMRAKLGFDVASVALSLGGGGHRQAAGVTLNGTLPDVHARLWPLLQQAASQAV